MTPDGSPRVLLGTEHEDHAAITVLGRMHEVSGDYWDDNWLVTRVVVVAGGMRADVGASLRADELSAFRAALLRVDRTLTGEAVLDSMESWLRLRVTVQPSGRLSVDGWVADRPRFATELRFSFGYLDVTYLPPVLDALAAMEIAYPVLGRLDHGAARGASGRLAAPFDIADPALRRFDAYGPAPFPDLRDTQLDRYVATLRAAGPAEVAAAVTSATEEGRRVLLAFAERAATRAVRDDAPGLLVPATIAAVVGGLDKQARQALMVMPLIEDAARRLGVPLPGVFEEVAEVVGHPGTVSLVRWLSRKPEDRTLKCMGFVAVEGQDGFRYEWTA